MDMNYDRKNWEEILRRSDELEEAILSILNFDRYEIFDSSNRASVSFSACSVSLDHSRALRLLMEQGLAASAICLMRMQYEALLRSVWLLYGASDLVIEKLAAPLTLVTEKAAKNIQSIADMLRAINGKAPVPATQMLSHFNDVSANALNSFVHGGIHPLQRQREGFPMQLAMLAVRNSNGLLTMTGMMFANLTGEPDIAKRMGEIQVTFKDCLPELLPHTAG